MNRNNLVSCAKLGHKLLLGMRTAKLDSLCAGEIGAILSPDPHYQGQLAFYVSSRPKTCTNIFCYSYNPCWQQQESALLP